MLVQKPAVNEETKEKLRNFTDFYIGKPKQGTSLNDVISEVLSDKDLFLYMATHSIRDSGIIIGRMNYFDDIDVQVPYGITYNFENRLLNMFLFEFVPAGQAKEPRKTLQLSEVLPSKKGMGIGTEENYLDYPSVEEFTNNLNRILQMNPKDQTPYWVDFNKPFYR